MRRAHSPVHVPILLSVLLLPMSPASAQIRGDGGATSAGPPNIMLGTTPSRDSLDRTIRQARRDGQLSRAQARSARRENRQISTLETRYGADGLSESERGELRSRDEALRSLVNAQRSVRPGGQ